MLLRMALYHVVLLVRRLSACGHDKWGGKVVLLLLGEEGRRPLLYPHRPRIGCHHDVRPPCVTFTPIVSLWEEKSGRLAELPNHGQPCQPPAKISWL